MCQFLQFHQILSYFSMNIAAIKDMSFWFDYWYIDDIVISYNGTGGCVYAITSRLIELLH